MKDKEIIRIINDLFKDYKIKIDVEQKKIIYYKSNDWCLGIFYLETNEFDSGYYWLYYNLIKHFKDKDEMHEFIKSIIEKIIGKSLNQVI